jgi:hypothetical protein
MTTWMIALLACSLPKDDGSGSDGDAGPEPATDSGEVSEGEVDYLGELDMRWQESAIVYREGECKLPLTLDLDDAGNITGGVTCEMADTGDTSLDFTGTLVGGTITGTVEFADSGFSWSDAWSGDLADEALSGVFEGYYEAGADAAWSYEGSFTLGP